MGGGLGAGVEVATLNASEMLSASLLTPMAAGLATSEGVVGQSVTAPALGSMMLGAVVGGVLIDTVGVTGPLLAATAVLAVGAVHTFNVLRAAPTDHPARAATGSAYG